MSQHLNNPTDPESPVTDRKIWDRRFIVLAAALFLLKLGYVLTVPLDLVPDEAYYWDWSRQLDWCYYSKPPMVAWVIALSTRFLGSTPFAVRLPAVLFSIAILCCLYLLGKRLFGAKTGFYASLIEVASPGGCALGLMMTIDAPLLCFWALGLYFLWKALEGDRRALEGGGRHHYWWFLSCLVTGLGLLSKPTTLAFLPLLFLFLFAGRTDRSFLRRFWPYAFVILSLTALIPVLWWNSRHDWITFQHAGGHFPVEKPGFPLSITTFLKFLGSQLGINSPIMWVLLAGLSGLCLRRFGRQTRPVQYLLMFSAVPLAGIFLLSFRQGVHANWPAPFYLAGVILLAAWGVGKVSCSPGFDRWRALFRPGIILGGTLALMTYAVPFFLPLTPLGGGGSDPTTRLRGWKEMGKEVGALYENLPGRDRIFIIGAQRQVVSELAFYLPTQPRVYHWPYIRGIVDSQYEVWDGPTDKIGWDSLIVTEASLKLPKDLRAAFTRIEPLKKVVIPLGPGGNRELALYRGYDLRHWRERK